MTKYKISVKILCTPSMENFNSRILDLTSKAINEFTDICRYIFHKYTLFIFRNMVENTYLSIY